MSSITSTNNYTNASGVASSTDTTSSSNGTVNQDQFLKLLVTQLQNQDPNNPTDQTQMLAQLAQFSSLSEMTTLNSTMSNAAQFSQVSQSASLIGKTVTAGTTADPVSGTVSYVTVQSGKAYLNIGGQDVDASTVTQVQ